MKTKLATLALIAALGLAGISCSVHLATSQPDANQVALQVAQTVAAVNAIKAQQQAAQPTLPPAPTIAPPPTQEPLLSYTPEPTATVTPCLWATAVDLNYPDHTDVVHGTSFNKTWRFTNVGYCTWNTAFYLAFQGGTQMGGASPTYLAAIVHPGESIDVTIPMTAPASTGIYTGNWGLYSNTGIYIGPVWVTIDVI